MSPANLVEIDDVSFAYSATPVLAGVALAVPPGKVVAIMGGSGSGKTTLLRLIGGALRPSRGAIRVFGQAITSARTRELYELRRRMGMLFQFGALFTDLSAFENVAFPMRELTPSKGVRGPCPLPLSSLELQLWAPQRSSPLAAE